LVIVRTAKAAGLPDGVFANQKYQFGYISEGKMLVYFIAIWTILWPFVH
jgi:hypothetical protein